jgi:hypothetical protein
MKKAFVLCFVLLLTACIDVDDYGDYWDKATIDPALEGRWAKVSEEDDSKLTNQEYLFTVKNNAYSVQSFKSGKPTEDDPIYPVKTLELGRYKFAASGPDKGTIIRYEINGNESTWYVVNPSLAWDFIQKNFPDQTGIYRDDPDPTDTAENNRDRPLHIGQFDDDVAKVLAAIPNNEVYWDPDTKLKKAQ